jgi:hypothetical protein
MKNLPKTSCPDQDTFARVFLNEASANEREAFIDHVLDCRACLLQFNILKQVGTKIRSREVEFSRLALESWKELKAQKRIAGPRRAWAGAARMAAGLLVVAGLLAAAYLVLLQPSQKEVLRSGEMRKLRLIEPEGKIPKPPALFKWTPVRKAESYTFELIDDNLQTLVRQDGIKRNSFNVPPGVQKKMAKGTPYIWTIEVYDDLGLKVDSGQQSFEIE